MKPFEFICFFVFGATVLNYLFMFFKWLKNEFKKPENDEQNSEVQITISVKKEENPSADSSPRP